MISGTTYWLITLAFAIFVYGGLHTIAVIVYLLMEQAGYVKCHEYSKWFQMLCCLNVFLIAIRLFDWAAYHLRERRAG